MEIKWDQYAIWFHTGKQKWILELFSDGFPMDYNMCPTKEDAETLLKNLKNGD